MKIYLQLASLQKTQNHLLLLLLNDLIVLKNGILLLQVFRTVKSMKLLKTKLMHKIQSCDRCKEVSSLLLMMEELPDYMKIFSIELNDSMIFNLFCASISYIIVLLQFELESTRVSSLFQIIDNDKN